MFVLPLENVENRGFQQNILIVEAPVDRAGRQAGVTRNAWNGAAGHAVLSQYFDRRLQ